MDKPTGQATGGAKGVLVYVVAAAAAGLLLYLALAPGGHHVTVMEFAFDKLLVALTVLIVAVAACVLGLGVLEGLRLRPSGPAVTLSAALGLGLGVFSLAMLGLGVAGLLSRAVVCFVLVAGAFLGAVALSRRQPDWRIPALEWSWLMKILIVVLVASGFVVLLAAVCDGILPPLDYDDLEYHLGVPWHYYSQGAIARVEGNVYANFPQNAEMLYLAFFHLSDNRFVAATMSRWLNVLIAVASVAAVYGFGRRLFGSRAAAVAAGLLLTTPWLYRLGNKGYVEHLLTLYSILALWAIWEALKESDGETGNPARFAVLAGVFAGLAMGTKYTGAVFVFLPVLAWLIAVSIRRGREGRRLAVTFAVVGVAVFTPWMLKNLVFAHNPVFPLLYRWLGGTGWSDRLNARWVAAHSMADVSPAAFIAALGRIVRYDPYANLAAWILLPFALLGRTARGSRAALALYVVYFAVVWFLFTHRVDRFYYPVLPMVCLLAGYGFSALPRRGGVIAASVLVGCCGVVSAVFVGQQSRLLWGSLPMADPQYNFRVAEASKLLGAKVAKAQESFTFRLAWRAAQFAEEHTGPDARMLAVGDAHNLFFPPTVITFTPLDANPLEEFLENGAPLSEILAWLDRRRVRYIYVNWDEVQRAHSTYGYTWKGGRVAGNSDRLRPAAFEQWVHEGVLTRSVCIPGRLDIFEIKERVR